MNSFNALGFLAAGSLMNALPALAPSLVARGPLLGDMTTSAIWLHLMSLVLGLIGCAWIGREVFAYYASMRTAQTQVAARIPVAVPEYAFDQSELNPSAQAA